MATTTLNSWLAAIDRPARQTLALAQAPFRSTVGLALAGSGLLVASSLIAEALVSAPGGALQVPKAQLLLPIFESLALVGPSVVIGSAQVGLRATSRTWLAAFSVGLLIAGVVTTATLPLMGYLVLVSRAQPYFTPALLLPLLGLAGLASTVGRVLEAIEDPPTGRRSSIVFQLALAAVFALRAAVHLGIY